MPRYQYLIVYQMPAEDDQDRTAKIAEIFTDWLMEEEVCGYTRSRSCLASEYKVEHRFSFSTLEDWVRFVESTTIDQELFRLETMVEELSTELWKSGHRGYECN